MGDREGRPYAGLVAELFGASPMPIFPMASFGSARDAARAWDATSHEGNEAVLDSRWATARPAGAIGSPLRGSFRRRPLIRTDVDAIPAAGLGLVQRRVRTGHEGGELLAPATGRDAHRGGDRESGR